MIFDAEAVSYSSVEIALDLRDVNDTSAYGTATEYRIVRNPAGAPISPLDGITVTDPQDLPPPITTDSVSVNNLSSGQWVYFSLFGRYELTDVLTLATGALGTVRLGGTPNPGLAALATPQWVLLASQAVLVPANYDYKARLWTKFPEWYRRHEAEEVGPGGVLRRFVNVLGYEVDTQRTWAATLGDVWDMARAPSSLLPHLGEMLGAPQEVAAGDKRYRSYLNNLMHFRKIKGTLLSIEGAVETVTGCRTLAYVGKNILLTVDDSDLRYGIGRWASTSSPVLVPLTYTEPTGAVGEPTQHYAVLMNTSGGSLTGQVRYSGTGMSVGSSVPVQGGHDYRFSFYAGGSDGATSLRTKISWYGQAGSFLSSVEGSVMPLGNVVNGGGVYSVITSGWVEAPDNAYFMVPEFYGTLAAGMEARVYNFMVCAKEWQYVGIPGAYTASGPSLVHEAARVIHVNVYPMRTNYAINSNFSQNYTDKKGWTTVVPMARGIHWYLGGEALGTRDFTSADVPSADQSTLTIDTTNHWATLQCQDLTNPRLSRAYSSPFPITGELWYSAAVEMITTGQNNTRATLRFVWYTGDAFTEIPSSAVVGESVYLTDDWQRVEVRNAQPPAKAEWAKVMIETINDVANHGERIRNVLIEDNAVPGAYFDGYTNDGLPGDYVFIGTPNESYSAYTMNYEAMVHAPNDSARAYTIALEYAPMRRDVVLHTAANGLL